MMFYADEANELMDWKESDPRNPQLDTLFRFLILISKQRNLVHVISASADYFLVSWLNASKFYLISLCFIFKLTVNECMYLLLRE
jgi:hypothetical protein